ncbi:MAG: helix-turn-helix domain-containing protein [Candidatus Nanoarchaeia archaeon]|nr:helix-turn-helix domain-containing protein [Candidatus Nanoarchaeia archaeon]MDD5587777.1 helix-turn-helix domain-containing protein [Candidatus Nanoarchaeia archaeon]
MELQELRILGLTNGEIKVYSAILHIGSSSINNIHEKTGMERRAIYDIINKLIEKGLISYTIEKGKRTYQCAPINKLKEEIKYKKEELDNFEKIIPEIEDIYKSKKPKISFEVFRGKEGIKTIFEDMLNYKDNYFIGGRWYLVKELPNYWKNYDKRRIEAGVKWHNLILHDAPETPTKNLISVKVLPQEFSGNPTIIWIYGNKVVHVSWSPEFVAFMIESKDIAENYKKYFKYLWENIAKNH